MRTVGLIEATKAKKAKEEPKEEPKKTTPKKTDSK